MAHYAFISNNKVYSVIVGKDENEDNIDWETYYSKVNGMECKRTSYNTYRNQHLKGGTAFRGNYAGIGYTYDRENDVFVPPQPYNSWTLSTEIWDWIPPVDFPDDNKNYNWNEDNQRWDLVDE